MTATVRKSFNQISLPQGKTKYLPGTSTFLIVISLLGVLQDG